MYSKVIPLHIYTYTYFLRFFSIIGYYKIFSIAPALPWWLSGEVSACNTGDMGSIPGSAMSPGEGTHSSILAWEIPWTKEPGGPGGQQSQTQLSDYTTATTTTLCYTVGPCCLSILRKAAWKVKSVSRSVTPDSYSTPCTVAHQAPLSLEFFRQVLEWVAIPFSRISSRPRDWTWASCIADSLLSEPPGSHPVVCIF